MHDHSSHISHSHDLVLIIISVIIAAFASYAALDIASSINSSNGKVKRMWIFAGSLAMGVGIWSMHFLGMLAFSIPGVQIYYDIPLVFLSILISIVGSYYSLRLMAERDLKRSTLILGSCGMGAAIAGMHYVGIWAMRMPLVIVWNYFIVVLSIVIAIVSSYIALSFAFRLRGDDSLKGFLYRGSAGILMGGAISSMHYVGMAAMDFLPGSVEISRSDSLLASDGLGGAIFMGTMIILGLALVGSNIDRSLERKNVLNQFLVDSIRIRDDFLSIASHELKTPLTALRLQIGLLERRASEGVVEKEKLLTMLGQGQKSITQISRVVEEMLDIARISTGKFELEKEDFSMGTFISELVERVRPSIEQNSVIISLEADPAVIGSWDKFRIEQIISNILSNTIQYSKSSKINIRIWKEGESAKISIADNGVGIHKSEHEKIFRRYERGDSSREYRGLGIGLYLVKEIVLLHGGQVDLDSDLGKGAKFTLTIPLKA